MLSVNINFMSVRSTMPRTSRNSVKRTYRRGDRTEFLRCEIAYGELDKTRQINSDGIALLHSVTPQHMRETSRGLV